MAKNEHSPNWGGARPGAGRKRKLSAREVEIMVKTAPRDEKAAPEIEVLPPIPDLESEPHPETAGELKGLALATLRQIMTYGQHDPSRATAAKEVLARAAAEEEAKGANGKKAGQQAAAEEIAKKSKFAAPPPPGAGSYARPQ